MRETMYDAPGVGLAAPQVGVGLQLAVIEDKASYQSDISGEILAIRERVPVPFHVIINPSVTLHGQSDQEFFEGCLSLHGYTALVKRHRKVTVECLDHRGQPQTINATGWYARILQHEIDHLQGLMYVDRMDTRSFMLGENFNKHCKGKAIEDVKQMLGSLA